MNGHTTCNCSRDETTHMLLRLLSDIEREREREREREYYLLHSFKRLITPKPFSTLLIGVQVEPWTINTDRLGHNKKCPYLRGVHINLSGPCYVNYVNLKINHLLKQNTGGIRGWTRESGENRVMKHDISIIKLNISGLPYVLLCSWKHAIISLKVTHLYIENRVHCMTKITG